MNRSAIRENTFKLIYSLEIQKAENIEEQIDLLDDFFYINETNQEKIQQTIISLCKGRLKLYGDYDFFNNIQIITPTKKGK